MFFGCGVGFMVLYRLDFIWFDRMLFVIPGAGLVCGAFTSFHGQRAWMMPSIFAPLEPAPHPKLRQRSAILGALGITLIVLPVVHHVATVGWPEGRSSSQDWGFSIFLLLFAAVPGFLAVQALRTGTGLWRFEIIHRDETPLLFWTYVFLNASAVVYALAVVLIRVLG